MDPFDFLRRSGTSKKAAQQPPQPVKSVQPSRPVPPLDVARANAEQRALEQRKIVLDTIQADHFIDLDVNSRAWTKIYGYQPDPVSVAPTTIPSAIDFEKTLPSYNMTTLTVDPVGSAGISTVCTFISAPSGAYNIDPADRLAANNQEIVIAEFPLGVGTDLAFLKPRFPLGEIEFGTTFSGFFRWRFDAGGPPTAGNSGFMDNGLLRFKIVDPMKQTSMIVLEVSTELFNAAAKSTSTPGSPRINFDLNKTLYPNFAMSNLVLEGSTLQVTITRLFENTTLQTDSGTNFDINTLPDVAMIDGSQSRFYIDTKRLTTLRNSQF